VKKRIGGAFLLLGLCSLLVVSAAAAAPAKQKPRPKFDPTCGPTLAKQRTVDGTLGSVTVQGTPKRVVALEFSFVDFLSQIGVKPVGIADDNDAKRITKPVLDLVDGYTSVGTRAAPSLEKIASLHPDLIIADADRHATILRQLQNIAPTIALDSLKQAYLPNLHSAVLVGRLMNKCGAMRVRVAQDKAIMARMKAAVLKATGGKGETRKTMFVVTTNKVFNVHSDLAYTPSLLQAIGIPSSLVVRPTKDVNPYAELTMESLLSNNPGIMFVAQNPPHPTTDENFSKSPLWDQLSAVKGKKVYYVNSNLWSKSRGLLAGELIAQQAVHLLYHKFVPISLPKVTVKNT
jgi:iron complex transport system substrate-binding protein